MTVTSRRVKPEELLFRNEESVPPPVVRAQQFLDDAGIWYRFGRNSPATSCRDAAFRRDRLGHEGIPLWDELKSLAFQAGLEQLIFVHCRADERVNLQAAAAAVGVDVSHLRAADELIDRLGLGYGRINPFETWDTTLAPPIIHVFDEGLKHRVGVPGTMMTNAGDLTWSVEFYPDELVVAMGAQAAPVAETDQDSPPRPRYVSDPRPIGIITGNSPESGMALWTETIDRVRELLGRNNTGDVSMPRVHVLSIPEMGLSMELDQRVEPVFAALTDATRKLCEQDCRLVSVACNTTQYFTEPIRAICSEMDSEFVSMPEAVADWLRAEHVGSVGLVGIRYVADLGEWSAYGRALQEFDIETPDMRGMERIEEIAYQVKTKGPSASALGRLHNVLRDVMKSDTVILALTELSTLVNLAPAARKPGNKRLIDPLKVYADRIAHLYLGMV